MTEQLKKEQQTGSVTFLEGRGELPMMDIITPWSTAQIYLQGANVTFFKKKDEAPLLFLSQCSRFSIGEPIRGGIPIVFPWFGAREGAPQHGFARLKEWALREMIQLADGSVTVRFELPICPENAGMPPFCLEYSVSVSKTLKLELAVTNKSEKDTLKIENCLHTYFEAGDISKVTVSNLKGVRYLDKTQNMAEKTETEERLKITGEVDRTYLSTAAAVRIDDAALNRAIHVRKKGSESTVVWNPWIDRAQQMTDFGNDEYQRMICVESGNVGPNALAVGPGKRSVLEVELSTTVLK
jgi:D-hexose-6-phosphate mutarotase